IIHRRTVYDLAKAQAREHILAGPIVALANIAGIVALIKNSASAEEAIDKLYKRFTLSAEQSKAILEMRLQRLTGLEREKIHQEMEELKNIIAYLKRVLSEKEVLRQEIVKELEEIKAVYGNERKTR